MITKQDAKIAAEQGLIPALKCSIEHHKDPSRMSSLELQSAIGKDKILLGDDCALCLLQQINREKKEGGSCILRSGCTANTGCCPEYITALRCRDTFANDPSNANHAAFLEAEEKMVARLEKELNKAIDDWGKEEFAKCKQEEVTYSAGDKFKYNDSREFVLVYTVSQHSIIMAGIDTGRSFASPTYVLNDSRITLREMQQHISSGFRSFTRYWDARKKEKC